MKSGAMPNTDFLYEEFENLLASFYLTLLPIKTSRRDEDKKDFELVLDILNGFAERHDLRKPEAAASSPRETQCGWGQPVVFASCRSLRDMTGSFTHSFGIGIKGDTEDGVGRCTLARIILGVLDRNNVIIAGFEMIDGKKTATKVLSTNVVRDAMAIIEVVPQA
jgi:hypothetical protein